VTRPATVSKPVGATPPAVVGAAVGGGEGVGAGAVALAVVPAVVPGALTAGAAAAVVGAVVATESGPESLHAANATNASTAGNAAIASTDRPAIAATVGVSVDRVPDTSTCDSCGAEEPELYAVHRQYVTPAEWDTPGREVTLDEVERWCYSCLTHYPHVLVGTDPSAAADG
jgi:hypothetical protein